MNPVPQSTLDFLAALPEAQRAALLALRTDIVAAAPEAEEYIGYGIPAFRQNGALVSFGATRSKCSLYVQSPAVMAAFADELVGRDTSKGTIRFTPDQPLPTDLVHRLVKARLAENDARQRAR
ncbi:MAG: iron chaperone [Devosia sp.]